MNTTFLKFGTKVNEVNTVTTTSLSPERIPPALLSWPCRWGVGHSNALWQGGPWCRLVRATCAPAPYSLYSTLYTVHCTLYTVQLYSWLCCNVNCVEMHNIHMCTSNVHFHCTALFSIAACVLQFVHSTVLHCSAFQYVCCVEQSLPCSAAVRLAQPRSSCPQWASRSC